jgi:glutamyl-tRNA reductase
MSVWALGLNHTTAPLDLRGRFAFAIEQVGPVLDGLRQSFGSQTEATILSTCNRTEIYCASQEIAMPQTLQWLAESGGVSPDSLHDHIYTMVDNQAARHAFRVASGLDSMVLGEPQILGQMKDAVRVAREVGALGSYLAPNVPTLFRGGQTGAQFYRNWRPQHQHVGRFGATGGAIV